MGADATFRGKIRSDQPGLRYNLLLIADADRGGQPRFVNLDTLRWVKALQRMSRPWGDPQASHNTIPREERRYAKDATYTTSGGNTGVRHFYPPGYGPLDDEEAPESRQPKAPISELRGSAGRDRFNKWLTEGGIGTRTRDFSEGENMDGLGVEFSAPGRGMLNDGGRWSRGRFMPTGAAERLAQSLGVQRIPMPRQRFSAGASSMGVGEVNHFFPGQRRASQDFALRPQPQLGALGNAQLVPIMLPQGQAPAVGVTPTGGYAPPPRSAALIPSRRFALGEQEMGEMPGMGFALSGTAFSPRYDSLAKTVSPPRPAAWQDPGGYKPPTWDANKTSPYTSNQSTTRLRFSRDQNQSLDDIIAGLGHDQPLSDEPWVEELTPQELAIQRTMTNIGRGKNKTPYEMNIADWAAQMANRRASGAANGPQQKARERLGHSSNMRAVIDAHQQQLQGQQPIAQIPTQPQDPQETPEQRRRRMSGRMLYSASGQSFRLDPNDERERRRQSEVDNWQRVQEMMDRRAYIASLPDTRYLPRPQLGAPDEPPTRYHPQMAHKSGYEAPRATASSNLTPEMIVAMLMNRRQRSNSLGEEIPRDAGLGMPDEMPRHRSSSGDQEVYLERNPVRGFGGPDHHSYLIARNQPSLQMDRVEQLDYTPANGGELDSLAGLHALSSGGAEPAQRPAAFAPRQVQQHQPDYAQSRAPRYPRQQEKPKAAIPWYGAFDPPRLENQPTQQAPRLGMNPIMAAPAARIALPSVQQRTPSQERAAERDVELSPEQAKIFIQEINKRQKGRGPGAFDRAAESASRAEGLRYGPRARFELGEQDFGLLDTIKHIGSMVNPVTNYRNLREGGHGRLASGAMVGGGLLGDAMLTGFHPPLVSLGVGRYAQEKAQAADRASDERRAEWMRG